MDRLEALVAEGARFVAAVERGDPDAPVPSCPGWALRDLVQHTGGVHRWATRVVTEASATPVDGDLEAVAGGWPDDRDLAAWFRAGHLLLVGALRSAPDDLACWTFLRAASPLEFWTRRQLHETAIHRVDAELASGDSAGVPVEVAVDGIDELLTAFLPRKSSRLRPASLRTIGFHATDAGAGWLVTAGPDGATTDRVVVDADAAADPAADVVVPADAQPADLAAADVVVRGRAADLYLLAWNRRAHDGLDVRGDTALLEAWRADVTVRWS